MELVADMLFSSLQQDHSDSFAVSRIQPEMRMRFAPRRFVSNGDSTHGESYSNSRRFNADRVLNRFWDYPRYLRSRKTDFDLFHVIDHSYAQVVHTLPPERVIVTCHDLDTFQCLLNPTSEPRSMLFKSMMRRTLAGFQKAARVICVSEATRNELVAWGLVDADNVVVVPNGIHQSYSPNPDLSADAQADKLLGSNDSVDILHVGSTIPRKRIDILLRVFGRLWRQLPNTRLLRIGGKLTREQSSLARDLGVADRIVQLPYLDRRTLAAVYRRATMVLLPSEREGFGLPVIEAMACGTAIVASDLPVLREVGGAAAEFCEVGNVDSWTSTIVCLLEQSLKNPDSWQQRRAIGLIQASRFSWTESARRTVDVYKSILG
jgi:glycosyltransferase involved in cell wall biosynthesis